ncbi:MAG: 50S ribosomal protein L11 methyltransferase [Deltaproteobacteria bacterium]|nr:50S ribosomal protein L11 methyltransferase [Deltaproteobacteria bacterium]
MKLWIEIIALGPRAREDEAIDALVAAGSPGVEEIEGGPLPDTLLSHTTWTVTDEIAGERSKELKLKAFIPEGERGRLSLLDSELKKFGWSFETALYRDQDWSIKWRASIKPVRVSYKGHSLVIRPTWKEVPRRPGDIIVKIDPGMAFGTGSHATTRMCLAAFLYLSKNNKISTFLDVGTGSGVLAIAARKLKVKKAVALDIDPVALKIARKNALLNRVAVQISKRPVQDIKGAFSVVTANILAGELKRLSREISARVEAGGYLILSGILAGEADSVQATYLPLGFKPFKRYSLNEWAALVLKKCI